MSERVPAWAESDERYPEREAEWRAAIARAERAEAGLAAMHAAVARWNAVTCDVRAGVYDSIGSGPEADTVAAEAEAACEALVDVVDDTTAAAEAYRGRVEAPMRAEIERLTAERDDATARTIHSCHAGCQRPTCVLRRERDTLAAALVEVRDAGRGVLEMFDADSDEDPTRADMDASLCALRDALAALPADLAAERDRRVRAEALEAAADAIERGSVLSQYGAHGWLRARAADERGGR